MIVIDYNPLNNTEIYDWVNKWINKKSFPYSETPTNKYKKNDGHGISLFDNYHSG